MPQTLAELKASSPAYAAMDDMEFASKVYRKHYADKMSFPEFAGKVGFDPYGDSTPADPTEGNSFAENALIGYGRAGMASARGIGQILGNATTQDVDEARRLEAPLMATAGGKVGNFLGQANQMMALPGIGGASRVMPYINAALQGAGFEAAQDVGSGESRAGKSVAGGLLGIAGQGVAHSAGALAGRAKDALNPVVQESIELAKRAKIPLHLSQVTDSKALKATTSALNYLPFSGAQKAGARQQEAFNAALGRSFGEAKTPVLSDEVMKGAKERLSQEFTKLYEGKHLAIAPDTIRRMMEIEKSAMENLPDEAAGVVRKQFDKIIAKAEDGSLTGEQYQALRTSLGEVVDGSVTGRYVKKLRQELDAAAKSALGPADAQRLTKAHGQWANLRTVEAALKQVEGSKGNVKPAALWALVRKGSTDEMRKLAQIGQNVLKDPIPDSGTPIRDLVYRGVGLGGGGAGAASALGAGSLLVPAAKAVAAGSTLARLLNSQTAGRVLGQGRPTQGLARLLQATPRVSPLAAPQVASAPLVLDIVGGRRATAEEMARDAEIARRARAAGL